MQKWQKLKQQLEIVDCGKEIFTAQQLLNFETETNITLPLEYKKFYQVFGTGMFGEFIGISCPTPYWVKNSKQYLENIRNEIKYLYPEEHGKNNMKAESVLNLIDSVFVFGDDSGSFISLWDLRTYREVDKSYDIYWINWDSFSGDIYKVGRDFYEFVKYFCLGTRAFEILPKSIRPEPDFIYNTFTSSSTEGIHF